MIRDDLDEIMKNHGGSTGLKEHICRSTVGAVRWNPATAGEPCRTWRVAWRAYTAELRIEGYEAMISWNVDCASCAHVLDASIHEHARAEDAERELGALKETILRKLGPGVI